MRYAQSLNYNISQCEFLLQCVGITDGGDLEGARLEAMDFLYDLRQRYRWEIEELNNGTHWVQTGATQ
tara:strand:- start:605 stop:808 length:204 start_codon:yes stop_codon:yes gene_type:complete